MSARRRDDRPGGLVIVDKPAGVSSHDVVNRLRQLAGTRRVGHAGTLDPLATGVLVIGVGQATRLLHHLVLEDKAYRATIRLGAATVSDDADGALLSRADASHLDIESVHAAMQQFVGSFPQVPSAVSAVKVAGTRSYARVRAGESVQLAPRTISVTDFQPLSATHRSSYFDVEVSVECSTGTYVRALARDLGERLSVGGHLVALRRTRVGPFNATRALTVNQLAERADPVVLPLSEAVRELFPVRLITREQAEQLSYGRFLEPVGIHGIYAVLLADGTVIGLLREFDSATARGGGLFARPIVVWHARE